jgi:peptidoglycan/xylan/chitin deacetylase (PgdA/CDA1 family)
MYHQIGDSSDSGLTVSVEAFAAQMRLLKKNGYHTISLEDMAGWLESDNSLPRKGVVITFDDGFKNIYTHAYPILEEHGFSATVFLVVDFLGKTNNWSENKEDLRSPLLSAEEIASMPNISYGSHSLSHCHLTQIPESEAYEEIVSSGKKLEDQLQVPIHSFCYPYGDYNESLVRLVEQAGYCCACSTRKGNRHRPEDRFFLKRIPITEISLRRFKYRLSSLYDWEHRWGGHAAE